MLRAPVRNGKSIGGRPPPSSSNLPTRVSSGTSSTASKARQSLSTTRRSSVMSSTTRRSSVFGSRMRTDPRAITDKKFMSHSVRKVITFLSERHYDDILSPKMFARPMKKDFMKMVTFLFKFIDRFYMPTSTGRFEDDVITLFRQLKYPFQISKTGLVACGSPHAWPPLLASLSWLIELLSYDDAVDQAGTTAPVEIDDEEHDPHHFFNYVSDSYKHFLSGDEIQYNMLQNSMEETFHETHTKLETQVETLLQQNESLKSLIQQAKQAKSTLPELNAKKMDLETDCEKFKILVAKFEAHKATYQAKVTSKQTELEVKESELAAFAPRLAALKATVATQEFSVADVAHLQSELTRLKSQLHTTTERRNESQSILWELEQQVATRLEALEESLSQYRNSAVRLKIMPISAKHAMGLCVNVTLDRAASDTTFAVVLSADVKQTIRPALQRIKKERHDQWNEALDRAMDLHEELDTVSERVRREEHLVEEMEVTLSKLDDSLGAEKEHLATVLQMHYTRHEDAEVQLNHVREAIGEVEDNAVLKQRVSDAKRATVALKAQQTLELSTMTNALSRLILKTTNMKDFFEKKLVALQTTLDTRLKTIDE